MTLGELDGRARRRAVEMVRDDVVALHCLTAGVVGPVALAERGLGRGREGGADGDRRHHAEDDEHRAALAKAKGVLHMNSFPRRCSGCGLEGALLVELQQLHRHRVDGSPAIPLRSMRNGWCRYFIHRQ